ncbi:MAG: glycosyltransferase [Planctomycetaceae bacterium]|nr:glycosyltransferase [Planctomycetaceae bacterium]
MVDQIDSSNTLVNNPMAEQYALPAELFPLVSVIVPTYKEAENLPVLVPQVSRVLARSGMSAEILIVDDNSPDATVAVCDKLRQEYPVRLLVRTTDRGLSSAVIHGLRHARGSVLLVMDADLSHPPEKVPELVAAVLEQQGEFVIGSRYVSGGTTDDDWSLFRWINSQVATWLSRGLTAARDPMAGFFALSRQTFERAEQLNPIGYKIGLELIVKCGCQRVAEVPIHFKDRLHGESKLSLKEQLNYLRHLGRLYRYRLGQWFTPLCFGLVGASGVVVDLLIFSLLLAWSSFPSARAGAICSAMTWNYLWNRQLTFADRRREAWLGQYLKFCASCLLGASLSWGISTFLWQQFSSQLQYPQIAAMGGILGGVLLNYLLSNHLVFRHKSPDLSGFLGVESVEGGGSPDYENPGEVAWAEASGVPRVSRTSWWLGVVGAMLMSLLITSPSWFRMQIDGLDQAHNVLTSVFFYDMYRDLPTRDLVGYTYDYQRQYPALGLMFWPPLFHATAGAAMLATGPSLTAIHVVLAGFALLLAVAMYLALSRHVSPVWACGAVCLAITSPVLWQLQNTVMLEVPSLAAGLVILWLYSRVAHRQAWLHAGEAVFAGVCCAAIAYTKQPAVFVLAGVFLDVLVNHRPLLKSRLTWLCVGTAGALLLPLAAFTWKYGKVNIAQSIGNQGNIYVDHHRVAERWSIEGWTYYPELLMNQLPWVALVLVMAGMLVMGWDTQARKKQGIWLWTALAWYAMFSYFDNKQIRFVAYAMPFVAIAFMVAGVWLSQRSRWAGIACLVALWGVVGWNVTQGLRSVPRGYDQMAALLAPVLEGEQQTNMAYFGDDHHLFTAQLRLLDRDRRHAMLRGDDLLADLQGNLPAALREFRVQWFLVDPELPLGQEVIARAEKSPDLFEAITETVLFDNGEKSFPVRLYAYKGALAETMKTVPLHSQMLGIAATQ